jgi:uncharacterized protein with HEPN domain
MSPPHSEIVLLADILEATRDAQEFIKGMTFEEFSADKRIVYAVIKAFEIIGEATKKVSPSFKEQNPGLPWRFMAGMRDKLIHDYSGVDREILWRTVTERLPPLEAQLVQLLSDIQS